MNAMLEELGDFLMKKSNLSFVFFLTFSSGMSRHVKTTLIQMHGGLIIVSQECHKVPWYLLVEIRPEFFFFMAFCYQWLKMLGSLTLGQFYF